MSQRMHLSFRKYHRWIGFFLAGIMALYASSGILMIFRTTDFLQSERQVVRQIEPGLTASQLSPALRMKLQVVEETDESVVLKNGRYDKNTGLADLTVKDYPPVVSKVVKMHKATTGSPLFFLNIAFGVALLFFVVSSFLMFIPKLPQYKQGLKIAGAGFVFAALFVMFGS